MLCMFKIVNVYKINSYNVFQSKLKIAPYKSLQNLHVYALSKIPQKKISKAKL